MFHLLNLGQKIIEVKTGAAFDFGGQLLRRLDIHAGGDLLDQSDDIAHAQNAPGVALGVKHLQTVNFLAGAGKFDRRARNLAYRQGRTATRVAIDFGQDDAGQRQRFFEGLGGIDRVLALHGVDHKQGLNRLQGGVQGFDFGHQSLVNG